MVQTHTNTYKKTYKHIQKNIQSLTNPTSTLRIFAIVECPNWEPEFSQRGLGHKGQDRFVGHLFVSGCHQVINHLAGKAGKNVFLLSDIFSKWLLSDLTELGFVMEDLVDILAKILFCNHLSTSEYPYVSIYCDDFI